MKQHDRIRNIGPQQMPDFTVIEGGGGSVARTDHDVSAVQLAFRRLIIEFLRATARGDDCGRKLSNSISEFYQEATSSRVPLSKIFDPVLRETHDDVLAQKFDESVGDERRWILLSSLRVIAESMATDPAARGRLSSRTSEFDRALESIMVEKERRARDNGWSYLEEVVRHLGPWPSKGGNHLTRAKKGRPKKSKSSEKPIIL